MTLGVATAGTDLPTFDVEAFLAGQRPVAVIAEDPRDDILFVRFLTETVVDEVETRRHKRPIYMEREMIHIAVPNSTDEVYDVLDDHYRTRFAKRYAQWKANRDAPINGTPLSQWGAISATHVRELEHLNIRSVEQLAEMPATVLGKLGPVFVDLGNKAKGFVAAMTGDVSVAERAAADAAAARDENARLQEQLAAMQAMLEQLTAPKDEAPTEGKRKG